MVKVNGYVFHDGYVEEGNVTPEKIVKSVVNDVSFLIIISLKNNVL